MGGRRSVERSYRWFKCIGARAVEFNEMIPTQKDSCCSPSPLARGLSSRAPKWLPQERLYREWCSVSKAAASVHEMSCAFVRETYGGRDCWPPCATVSIDYRALFMPIECHAMLACTSYPRRIWALHCSAVLGFDNRTGLRKQRVPRMNSRHLCQAMR
ncbi:uncharacterized protein SCHCODRAFT_02072753 [Schizophyllum commune H4-8]|uniref:uncharacterized protein n=1 Tax=Schizophyllum commune (strain H4-8 / FGSC 9210) TaxID=578458 RepID=UPI0021600372|nr:uncharacterized protein SCHCODRAFT_02072753 [Schizophyllum commune H4-8]KAI5887814.1 hypothetical protein SCHCODRAFT_02072753 [Schizophyllum commune H4-8]